MNRVVVTGAAGLLGSILLGRLGSRHDVVGLDRSRSRDPRIRRVDMAKRRPDASLFRGADAVVDLAGSADSTMAWRDVSRNNVPASMHALEAARLAGVRRVVFASSNHVTGGYETEPPYASIVAGDYCGLEPDATPLIDATWPVRPDGPYALGKVLAEAACRLYADRFGLSVVCLRIGSVLADDRPHRPRHFATMLTHADLGRLVEAALGAPDEVRFGVYYGVSGNTWRFWDVAPATAALGYEPQDDAESFRTEPTRGGLAAG